MDSSLLFEAFNDLQIMVIGDVMIDRYLGGKVNRISPEAPVPIVRLQTSDNRLGGAANVALNIKALGGRPYLFSMIGNDENAAIFESLLPKNDLWTGGILRSEERCTTVKTRVLASNQQMLRVDKEDTHDLSSGEEQELLLSIFHFLDRKSIDVIILQDYNKGVFSPSVIKAILSEAEKRDIRVVVDPKKNNFFQFKGAYIFKPNLKEIRESVPFEVTPDLASLQQASHYLREQSDNKKTLITLSEKGMFVDDGNRCNIVPTQVRIVADVCGAGDSVISIVAIGLALDLNLEDIAVLANLAGGQVCERVGVVPIDKNQLKREYDQLLQRSY